MAMQMKPGPLRMCFSVSVDDVVQSARNAMSGDRAVLKATIPRIIPRALKRLRSFSGDMRFIANRAVPSVVIMETMTVDFMPSTRRRQLRHFRTSSRGFSRASSSGGSAYSEHSTCAQDSS